MMNASIDSRQNPPAVISRTRKPTGKANFRDFCSVTEYFTIKDTAMLFIGCFLASLTGGGLPHLVCVVGWMLDVFVSVYPFSEEFRSKITPLLLYFCSAAFVLAIIAFLQFVCFRLIGLKIARRIRRAYFRGLIGQRSEYFADPAHETHNGQFEADIQKLVIAFTDALPALLNTIAQVTVSLLISFYLSWRLAWPITCLGMVAFLWILIFTAFGMSATRQEAALLKKTLSSMASIASYRDLCNDQYRAGLKRAVFFGIVAGSMQLFIFAGMGLGALYGNWLIDANLMDCPGYIFVIACSIIPAACRLGQIHFNWTNFLALKFACKQVHQVQSIQVASTIYGNGPAPSSDHWTNLALKRKQFLLTFFKNELGGYLEETSFHPRNTSAFLKLRKSACQKWKLYAFGFVFCLIFAAGPPTFTFLNGNLYEFYKPGKSTFFYQGVSISWKYLSCGVVACIAGIVSMGVFARNGEAIAREIRSAVFTDAIHRHGGALSEAVRASLIPLISTSANNCKGVKSLFIEYSTTEIFQAFDAKLAQFSAGVFTLAFGIAYVFEKNLVSAFLCSICFVIQAINQYVIFRIAHIHTKRAMAEKNEKGRIALAAFEELNENEISITLDTIGAQHDSYLSLAFEKHTSVIPVQALKYTFTVAIPQVTQAIAYVIGCYLVMENMVRPVVIYKVVQTLYMSAFAIATIAQYNADVDKARLSAISLQDVLVDDSDTERSSSPQTQGSIHELV